MRELILYLGTFILAYLFYLIFVLGRKSVLKKFPEGKEMSYLRIKYKVKINDDNLKKIANKICLANSFILATTVYIVCLFDSFILGIVVSVPTLLVLILVLYHIIGTHYSKKQNKGGKKHV